MLKVSNGYLQTYLPKSYRCCHLSHAAGTETFQIRANTSRQALAPSSCLAPTGADGSLGCICPTGKHLQRISSIRKPPGFLLGTPVSELAQRPPYQQGLERGSYFGCMSIHPSWWSRSGRSQRHPCSLGTGAEQAPAAVLLLQQRAAETALT